MHKHAPLFKPAQVAPWLMDVFRLQDRLRFDHFMQLALYHPRHGYYSRGEGIFGAQGDFVTAPELSPLFGQTLAHALRGTVEMAEGTLWEFGAGQGKLAIELLNGLGDEIKRYCIVELSGHLRETQRHQLQAHSPVHVHKVEWVEHLPEHLTGVVLGNEVLDAMPVRLWRWYSTGIYELWVESVHMDDSQAYGLQLVEQPADEELERYVTQLHENNGPWPQAYQSEWGQQALGFVTTITEKLQGVAIFIDYGFPQSEYYHAQRNTGTLVAHYRHTMHDHILHRIGQQDLTAHVDFTAIYDALIAQGGELMGYGSQSRVLREAGILDRATQNLYVHNELSMSKIAHIKQQHALHLLLSEAEMGELFKVMVWCKKIEPVSTHLSKLLQQADQSHRL